MLLADSFFKEVGVRVAGESVHALKVDVYDFVVIPGQLITGKEALNPTLQGLAGAKKKSLKEIVDSNIGLKSE